MKRTCRTKNKIRTFELNNRQKELEQLRKKESEELQQLAQIQTHLSHYLDLKADLERRIAANKMQAAEIAQELNSKEQRIVELKDRQQQLVHSLHSSDEVYNRVSIELSEITGIYNQAKLELLKWQNRFENINKDLDYKNKQIEELQTQTINDELKQTELIESLGELETSLTQYESELLEVLEFRKIWIPI